MALSRFSGWSWPSFWGWSYFAASVYTLWFHERRPSSLVLIDAMHILWRYSISPSGQLRKWHQKPFRFDVITLQGLIGPICQFSEAGPWLRLSFLACFLPLCWHWSTFVKLWPCPFWMPLTIAYQTRPKGIRVLKTSDGAWICMKLYEI